jgi:deoxyribodipyrimidine photo-lyase
MSASPANTTDRVRAVIDLPPAADGDYVLYWMIGARRPTWNFALDRSAEWARHLGKPLLVLEALDCTYRWASDRLHRFVLDGIRDNRDAFARAGVAYYPYVEPAAHAGRGLLHALSARAAVVVTDRAPVFRLPALVSAAAPGMRVRFEEVDGAGLLPIDASPAGHVFPTAYAFRRHLQKTLGRHLNTRPRAGGVEPGELPPPPAVPQDVLTRWPAADDALLDGRAALDGLPIDHSVAPAPFRGGSRAAAACLEDFVEQRLAAYGDERNHPDDDASSGLSPYLHFGHVSPHAVVTRVLRREGWKLSRLTKTATGAKTGWWGASAAAEAYLDQIVTWRELGLNMSARRPDFDRFESLPPWAILTLDKHAGDARPHLYSLDAFTRAATHDPLWNAAQRQLVTEGRMHNYLRMLWGKKILEWTRSPREALDVMIELNNRFALDGRDPNSYTGIFWVLGRYDRPWFERPIFGSVRYMTSASAARKLHLKTYLARFGPALP